MSGGLGPSYNPDPTKEWTRFENNCVYPVNLPASISPSQAHRLAMLYKGNILQYKNNSSNITKSQKYGQIAKGSWINRNTTWATQSQSYTNPNTQSLRRVSYSTITPTSGGIAVPTGSPLTCPPVNPVIPIYPVLPNTGGGGGGGGPPPPVIPPQPSGGSGGPVLPDIIPTIPPEPLVIPDGGILICGSVEDLCNPTPYVPVLTDICNPTTASDVPGPIEELCYNDGLPTYYPKTKLTYATSGNKWPTNEKFFRSANAIPAYDPANPTYYDQCSNVPTEPLNFQGSGGVTEVTLSWTTPVSDGGASILNYIIYYYTGDENSQKVAVSPNMLSTTIKGLLSGNTYYFSIVAINANGSSPSSSIVIPIGPSPPPPPPTPTAPSPPTILSFPDISYTFINLSWTAPSDGGSAITSYDISYSPVLAGNQASPITTSNTDTSYNVTDLSSNVIYTFEVAATNIVGTSIYSDPSSATTTPYPPPPPPTPTAPSPPTILSFPDISYTFINLSWTAPSDGGSAITSYDISYSPVLAGNQASPITTSNTDTSYNVTDLSSNVIYTFEVAATNIVGTSIYSDPSSATTTGNYPWSGGELNAYWYWQSNFVYGDSGSGGSGQGWYTSVSNPQTPNDDLQSYLVSNNNSGIFSYESIPSSGYNAIIMFSGYSDATSVISAATTNLSNTLTYFQNQNSASGTYLIGLCFGGGYSATGSWNTGSSGAIYSIYEAVTKSGTPFSYTDFSGNLSGTGTASIPLDYTCLAFDIEDYSETASSSADFINLFNYIKNNPNSIFYNSGIIIIVTIGHSCSTNIGSSTNPPNPIIGILQANPCYYDYISPQLYTCNIGTMTEYCQSYLVNWQNSGYGEPIFTDLLLANDTYTNYGLNMIIPSIFLPNLYTTGGTNNGNPANLYYTQTNYNGTNPQAVTPTFTASGTADLSYTTDTGAVDFFNAIFQTPTLTTIGGYIAWVNGTLS
jgi:hypothetical protein